MSKPESITETLFLHLRDGVNLEDVASSHSPQTIRFTELTKILKGQPGYVRQCWGHQIEDPKVFLWCIEWQTFDDHVTWSDSEASHPFRAGVAELFDISAGPPIFTFTKFNSDAYLAFTSTVTEVAFFTVPFAARDEAKALIEAPWAASQDYVFTVGKSTGGATGYVFETKNADNAAPEGHFIALHGIFGYDSVEDHLRWRQTPEHAKVIEDIGASRFGTIGMDNAILPDGKVDRAHIVPDQGVWRLAIDETTGGL